MFKVFGHEKVSVLDGGFPKWVAEGRAVEDGINTPEPATFRADKTAGLVRARADVLAIIEAGGSEQILDARARGRFTGEQPEPREGMRSGHMPGALNLPYTDLLAEDGTFRGEAELEKAFKGAGVDLGKPVVTSCGSGVSAAVLLMGLHLIGHDKGTLYDGSWSEWGGREDTPIVTGNA